MCFLVHAIQFFSGGGEGGGEMLHLHMYAMHTHTFGGSGGVLTRKSSRMNSGDFEAFGALLEKYSGSGIMKCGGPKAGSVPTPLYENIYPYMWRAFSLLYISLAGMISKEN